MIDEAFKGPDTGKHRHRAARRGWWDGDLGDSESRDKEQTGPVKRARLRAQVLPGGLAAMAAWERVYH